MSVDSSIEWTDATWNPTRGCTKVSPGCKHCYAETFAERWRGVRGHAYEQGFDFRLVPDKLLEPLHWKKPRRIFVNSMSDLFHEDTPDRFLAAVFGVMAAAHWHTFQVLTKRGDRLPKWFAWLDSHSDRWQVMHEAVKSVVGYDDPKRPAVNAGSWPLPNVWLGVSAENQEHWDERVQHLGRTPAAVRFVSAEPLLGPIDCGNAFDPRPSSYPYPHGTPCHPVDWVIIGGESGVGARPMQLDWARSVVEQCRAADVRVFTKQMGAQLAVGDTLVKLRKKGGIPELWPGGAARWPREYPNAR